MRFLLACSSLLLVSCAGFTDHLTETGKYLAPKIAVDLVKAAVSGGIQTLTSDGKANYLDTAAQAVRANWSQENTDAVIKIWTTPPKQAAPAPEMVAVANKAAELQKRTGADPETLATALNMAAAKVRGGNSIVINAEKAP